MTSDKEMTLSWEEIITLYSLLKGLGEQITSGEVKLLMKLEKHLFNHLTIDEIEEIEKRSINNK